MRNHPRSVVRTLVVGAVLSGIFTGVLFGTANSTRAALRPESVHVADAKKMQAYVRDGMFVGGDRTINDVTVKDIRRASNAGFERIVIDMEGNRDGEPVAIQRPPYFQISVSPEERRLIFSVWGSPKLGFDAKKVVSAFRRSKAIDRVELLPKLDKKSWTFVMGLKTSQPVEVFELSNPVRIIVDVRTK